MIKAIIFDYGGEFTSGRLRGTIKDIAKKNGFNPDEFRDYTITFWNDAKTNMISSKEFWEKCGSYLGISADDFRKELLANFSFNSDMLNLAKELSKKYYLALLTNNIEDWFEEERKLHKLDEIFSKIITSYEEEICKPDPESYSRTLKMIGFSGEDCVFIDDSRRNLPTAQEFGIHTIHFENLTQLKEELDKILN